MMSHFINSDEAEIKDLLATDCFCDDCRAAALSYRQAGEAKRHEERPVRRQIATQPTSLSFILTSADGGDAFMPQLQSLTRQSLVPAAAPRLPASVGDATAASWL